MIWKFICLKFNIIKNCSVKGRPCKYVTTAIKYINDTPTYTDFCTASIYIYIMLIYIYRETFKNLSYLKTFTLFILKYILVFTQNIILAMSPKLYKQEPICTQATEWLSPLKSSLVCRRNAFLYFYGNALERKLFYLINIHKMQLNILF